MSTYLFRFKNEEGTATAYMGIVSAMSMYELWWAIDEYGDPNGAEYLKCNDLAISMCFKYDDDETNDEPLLSEQETGGIFWLDVVNKNELGNWKKFIRSYSAS